MTQHSDLAPVGPSGVIGIIGGGQLGRMLSLAAARLGLDVHIFAPEPDSPAERVSARTVIASYNDKAALKEFAAACNVVTFEFENVPAASLDVITGAGAVFPGPLALAVSQDRLREKTYLQEIGVTPAPFAAIDGPDDIAPALDRLGGKGILKGRFSGYDGKGQARLATGDDVQAAWTAIGAAPAILEAFVPFECEVSVVIARGRDGATAIYDVPRNLHESGILRSSTVPSGVDERTLAQARDWAVTLCEALDYVGVLALELFVLADGSLLANEFAPRVHNSGHWTEAACQTSQFEQHVRAVCGWPLGPVTRHNDVEMENLLGDSEVASWAARAAAGESVQIYGKRGGGEGRKLGHINRLKA